MDTLLKIIPEKYAVYGTAAVVLIQVGGRVYHSFASGNGVVGAWKAFLYGTNTPKSPTDNTPTSK